MEAIAAPYAPAPRIATRSPASQRGKARATAEVQYDRLKKEARIRAKEADVLVHERPYAALTAAALAGFLIGHLISSNKANVVYLRDDR